MFLTSLWQGICGGGVLVPAILICTYIHTKSTCSAHFSLGSLSWQGWGGCFGGDSGAIDQNNVQEGQARDDLDVQEGPARNNPGAIDLNNVQEGPARETPGAIDLDVQEGPARINPGAIDLNNVQEGPARETPWAIDLNVPHIHLPPPASAHLASSRVHLLQMRSQ